MAQKKIHVIMRDAGVGSRRKAEELIREGLVTLNGEVVEQLGVTADPETDHIKVAGKLIRPQVETKSYYIFNKPRFVVSTFSDPQDRPTVGELVKPIKKRLFMVGRLDFDAEGLIILSNDGSLTQKLSHPSSAIERTYLVKVRGTPDSKALGGIRKGMPIGGGERVGEINWTVTKRQKTTTWLKIILREGKKNEIKRIFFRIGHPVRKLRRVGFGPLSLGTLPTGAWRELTAAEQDRLIACVK